MSSRQTQLDLLIEAFRGKGFEQPQFEARQLMQEALGLSFAQIISQPECALTEAEVEKLRDWSAQRLQGYPLAYLSGHKGFYKYDFAVEPGVLIPRPETELVVETLLRRAEELPSFSAMADLGCGSGCIGLSVAMEWSQLELWCVDMAPKACEVTERNAKAMGLGSRVNVVHSKVEEWSARRTFDAVVANPPYISTMDPRVEAHVRKYEPSEALFAADEGLDSLREWTTWAALHLTQGGLFVCEFGAEQGRPVQEFLAKSGFGKIQLERDWAGHDRVVSAFKER